jgi:hypothetical protein
MISCGEPAGGGSLTRAYSDGMTAIHYEQSACYEMFLGRRAWYFCVNTAINLRVP